MEKKTDEKISSLNYASFNQDGSCFSIGTDIGFKIFSSSPFRDNFERVLEGGIGICEMLNRCNILALVGGGKAPKYSPNKVIIWDDHQSKVVSELRFTSYVRNVKLKKDRLIVVCDQKIYLFNLLNFQNIDTIDTYENVKGLLAIAIEPKTTILAYPDKNQGVVRIKFYDKDNSVVIQAHESSIACMGMNYDGTMLATASDKGTLIRVYNSHAGQLIQELRRGTEKAIIYSIAFNQINSLLATSSDRGTIHIFSLSSANKALKEGNYIDKKEEEEINKSDTAENKKSIFGRIANILPIQFLNSEWSFAQFRIPPEYKGIVNFGPDHTINVITYDGKFYIAQYDPVKGGDCVKKETHSIII